MAYIKARYKLRMEHGVQYKLHRFIIFCKKENNMSLFITYLIWFTGETCARKKTVRIRRRIKGNHNSIDIS